MGYDYDFGIYPSADREVYEATCGAVEDLYPEFDKKDELVDVDDSRYQAYVKDDVAFNVCLDYYQGDVNIQSNENIEDIVEVIRKELRKRWD